MATHFLTGNDLNAALEHVFEDAEFRLVLISPYILLHDRYASVLKSKLENHEMEISLVFGKNEEDPSRSMRRQDLDFFMQFPNIDIRYEPRLHAKYYANDRHGIITSMNLYRYSQDHNIEAGLLMEAAGLKGELTNRLTGRTDVELDTYSYFDRVIDQARLIYERQPKYESSMMGLKKKYIGSEVTTDIIAEFFSNKNAFSKPHDAPKQYSAPKTTTPKDNKVAGKPEHSSGYCIRTGGQIPFNVEKPLSYDAYKSWSKYSDKNYKEKFCHFSGEASNGETTVAKPILKTNWSKAKAAHNL